MKRMLFALTIAILFLGLSLSAQAGTQTASMSVTGSVSHVVTVTVAPLDFGTLNPGGGDVLTRTTITVNAPRETYYRIALNAGLHRGGTPWRGMRGTGNNYIIYYQLFKDPARTQVWGDSDYENTFPFGSSSGSHEGNGFDQEYTVYVRTSSIPADIPAGTYTDTVVVTVHY